MNKKTKPAPKKRFTKEKKSFDLPDAKSEPSENLNDYSFLCYGRKKIGKTSLFGRRDKTLFFLFEPGAKAQSIYKVPTNGDCFTDWSDVIGYAKSLNKNKHDFETVIFDTGKPAYELCLKYYCEKQGITHPGAMKDYGASWNGVTSQFKDLHLTIASAGIGFVVIAHEKQVDFKGADGKDYVRTTMNFSGAVNDFYEGIIDVICHYGYIGKERWLTIRGDEFTVAGCRIENHFLTPKGEKLYHELKNLKEGDDSTFIEIAKELGDEQIYKIPMGNNPNVSHKNLLNAFNNKQTETFKEMKEETEKKTRKRIKQRSKKKVILKK